MNSNPIFLESMTDWAYVDSLCDEEIDLSECPEITPEMFAKALIRKNWEPVKHRKSQVTLRLDTEVLEWFKLQGKGYQTRMNELLRAYMVAQKKRSINITE